MTFTSLKMHSSKLQLRVGGSALNVMLGISTGLMSHMTRCFTRQFLNVKLNHPITTTKSWGRSKSNHPTPISGLILMFYSFMIHCKVKGNGSQRRMAILNFWNISTKMRRSANWSKNWVVFWLMKTSLCSLKCLRMDRISLMWTILIWWSFCIRRLLMSGSSRNCMRNPSQKCYKNCC